MRLEAIKNSPSPNGTKHKSPIRTS